MQLHTDWSATCKESFHRGTNNNYISGIIDEHHEERTLRAWLTDYKHIWYFDTMVKFNYFFYQFQFLIILNNDTDILLHTKE